MAYSAEVLYLPAEVESLQQLYPALSGGHTVRRVRLHRLRAHHHTSKHQQGSDGKPAPEPRMHTHSKHLLQKRRETHKTEVRRRVKSGALHYCNLLKHPTLLFSPRVGLWHQTVGSRKLLQTHEPQSAPGTSAFCWEAARSRTLHPPAALENTAGQGQIKGIFVCRFRYMQHLRTN